MVVYYEAGRNGFTPAREIRKRGAEDGVIAVSRLESLAKYAKLSPEYLCRAFRKYTGNTVFSHLVQRRIQDAVARLRFTEDKASSIALECGFNDFSYFNRKFKELSGRTPGEYRRFLVTNASRNQ
ncbi:MAG TPA: hypothetical protein DET40_26235 [Lentisphaeria bacterium]|nr:MAG: hypothetical protein A2X45_11760 [Lentisphaerae bacterium GWF2_50_93]HCE47062.1 hypothetical protein [Lentisphaeria bacterium]